MSVSQSFIPVIAADTNLQTCIPKTSANTSASIELGCQEFLVKCLTYPVWIRLGPASVTAAAANGYYMAVGDEIRLQAVRGATHLAVINVTNGEHGVISVMPGSAE